MQETAKRAVFFPISGEVTIGEQRCRLRPKTFLLAEYLSQRLGEVVSKEEILDAVWEGSIVEEQAVFQSINEIRKGFAPTPVIQTYPRKGYVWLVPVEGSKAAPLGIPAQHTPTLTRTIAKHKVATVVAAFLLTVFVLSYKLTTPQPKDGQTEQVQSSSHRAVLVLPVDTSLLSDGERWLSVGTMDAVIGGFEGSKDLTAFQVSDVLDILNRVDDPTPEPKRLFEVSAATHIVEAQISGVPGEYHLVFSIYQQDKRQQGSVHGKNIDDLLNNWVDNLLSAFHHQMPAQRITFNRQFTDSLMFNAIRLLAVHDFPSASAFLQSVIAQEPDNLAAYFLLAKTHNQMENFQAGEQVATQGINQSAGNDAHNLYLSRLQYLKGASLLATGSDQAKHWLTLALESSTINKDWLYVAYAKSLLAQHYLLSGQKSDALPLLEQSLAYQQMLGCPMGVAQGHLDFIDYYLLSNDVEMAEKQFDLAEKLVSAKGLEQVKPLLQSQQQKIKQYQLESGL